MVPQKHPELGSNRIPNVWDAPHPRMVDKSVKIRHYPSPQEDSQLSILIYSTKYRRSAFQDIRNFNNRRSDDGERSILESAKFALRIFDDFAMT